MTAKTRQTKEKKPYDLLPTSIQVFVSGLPVADVSDGLVELAGGDYDAEEFEALVMGVREAMKQTQSE